VARVLLCLCLSVCVVSFICSAGAQVPGQQVAAVSQPSVPRLVKFSGTLKDNAGRAKTGMAAVTFAIYGEQEGGTALWMETQNVTLEEGGKYTVLLGANSDGGVPMELFTDQWRVASGEWQEKDTAETQSSQSSADRWLGVGGPEIQTVARVLLVSVPYALRAADAEKLGGLPASAFLLAPQRDSGQASSHTTSSTGTIGAGTQPEMAVPLKAGVAAATGTGSSPAPTVKPNVATATKAGTATAKTAAGAETPDPDDFVAKFSATASLVPSAIFEVNGNVGIGTTAPTAALHVVGDTVRVTSPTTAQLQVTGPASSGRFGQDAAGAFLASDTTGSSVRFLTSNGNLNEWMRIGSRGSVNIGSAQAAQFGEAVFAPDNLDTVHSATFESGSQYHFRLSRAAPDVLGSKDFLITPYTYGMAIEYPGTLEVWSGNFSVHINRRCPVIACGPGANLWVGDEIDSGGLWVTGLDSGGGTNSNVILAADRFNHTSHGSLNFVVRNTTDAFRFDVGAFGSEVMAGQISGTASASNLDLFNGPVQATLRAANGSTVDAEIGATSNHPLSLFANNGAARVTLFPSGNFSIGNSTDTAALAVGTTAQFQVTAAGAVTIGGGTAITQHVSITAALAFGEFSAHSCNTLSVAVNGAAEGDTVALGMPNAVGALDGVTWFGWVSGPGVVSIRGCNATVSKVAAPPAANVRVDLWQH